MSESSVVDRRHVLLGAAIGAVAATAPTFAQAAKGSPEAVDALSSLLDSYNKALSAHDVAAMLKLYAPDAVVVGTGHGEIWGGPTEIADAYKHIFELFDPGKQKVDVIFRDGHILGDMAWMVSVEKVTFTKGAKATEFGLNSTAVFEKTAGNWLIRAHHYSNAADVQAAAK